MLVFVHSRKGTGTPPRHWQRGQLWKARLIIEEGLNEARTKSLGNGMGIHYAGMLRHDRKLSEQIFSDGAMCAMLYSNSWGINLMVGNMHD